MSSGKCTVDRPSAWTTSPSHTFHMRFHYSDKLHTFSVRPWWSCSCLFNPLPELGFTPWICYFLSEFRLNLCSHYILWHSCLKIHHQWQREDFLQIITHRKSLLWIRQNSRSNPLWSLDSDRPGCRYNLFHHIRAVQILCSKLQQASGGGVPCVGSDSWSVHEGPYQAWYPQLKPALSPFHSRERGRGSQMYKCIAEAPTLSSSIC